MNLNICNESIKKSLSENFNTVVTSELIDETEELLVYEVKIKKPKDFMLYRAIEIGIGRENFKFENNTIIFSDDVEISDVNDAIKLIERFDKSAKNIKFCQTLDKVGLILTWETE